MNLNALPQHHYAISAPPPPPPPPPRPAHIHHKPYAFYWGKESQFLFSGWPDNHSGMYTLALILVFVLAILHEFLSNLNLVKPDSNRAARVFFQAGIQAIRAGFGYLVILAVMSYNGGVFLVAVFGHAVGQHNDRRLAVLGGAALRALKMFMTYLAIVAIMATDFVFFLVAVGGHAVGNFVAGMYQYHIEQTKATMLYDGSF
ncbi:hypothetical protein BUALT_Bualt09G0119600 [Buddleja alternifolia]|uniref:Copper transport protein n=1 Tax=Buddleja alternifolia TaxID=168488 RepID=A0AAV6X9Z9_9LAMI|nr:hypothetical protein BUALT_Bualt09G0119600 [Buddleja alternifolia]